MKAPHPIVSLWDMLQFHADHFIGLSRSLNSIKGLTSNNEIAAAMVSATVQQTLAVLERKCEALDLPLTRMSCADLRESFTSASELTIEYLVKHDLPNKIDEIQRRLTDELSMRYFLSLNAQEASLYKPGEEQVTAEFKKHFPNLLEDAVEASKCLGLGRYTAAVFHLMRVMEVGVQKFGEKLGVTLLDHRGREKNWQNLLDESNKRIRVLSSQPPIDPLAAKYAAVASHLYNVKLAWRNEVMHPKATYTQEEATEIDNATRRFMRELISLL